MKWGDIVTVVPLLLFLVGAAGVFVAIKHLRLNRANAKREEASRYHQLHEGTLKFLNVSTVDRARLDDDEWQKEANAFKAVIREAKFLDGQLADYLQEILGRAAHCEAYRTHDCDKAYKDEQWLVTQLGEIEERFKAFLDARH